jgi:hypothetical protein
MPSLSRSEREARIVALISGGSTEGERSAARAALTRLRAAEVSHTAEIERLLGFGWNPARMEAEAAEHAATMERLDLEAGEFGGDE